MRLCKPFALLVASVLIPQAYANDFENAPAAFEWQGQKVVPADFERVELGLTFNSDDRTATGKARITLKVPETGYPTFDLVRSISAVKVDGEDVGSSSVATIDDPDDVTSMRVLKVALDPAVSHTLEIEYDLTSEITFTSGNVRAGFFMSDLRVRGRGYFEQYGPASFEWDQYDQVMDVQLVGVEKDHTIFANGEVVSTGPHSWRVTYPGYFTTSSFYFHLTESGRFRTFSDTYKGLERDVEVTIYSAESDLARRGLAMALRVLEELETTYGPYAHTQALAYITSGGGGMEHAGATMTSLWALEHEFTHFWFARGVMPADGNAGWIDEAVASWRDDGYPRASRPPSGRPHNLGGFSQYRRHTTQDAYTLGAGLISELDNLYSAYEFDGQTGMKGVLRNLFTEKKRQTISVDFFKTFIEKATGTDLTNVFERYVYGRSRDGDCDELVPCDQTEKSRRSAGHPRPFTPDEMRALR